MLRLDETRIIPPPPFEEVKDQLVKHLQNENIRKHITDLRENSKIEIRGNP